ncbi:MAG: 4Fe-4S binding protein, partial [Candidatus Methanomethylophilus sp.]|nr:4Fe-4S binding protein [Methanomethylophilus sp.]
VGRMEGQNLLSEAAGFAVGFLEGEGAPAVMPLCDRRMQVAKKPGSNPNLPPDAHYTSTWSERHNGFICGLGTFGLSKGLITAKGMAGRMFSIITEAVFPITERGYTGLYEYCTGCGACIKRCPAGAITAKGKDHELCVDIILRSMVTLAPRYGCGKCQCGVPCEAGIPAKGRR